MKFRVLAVVCSFVIFFGLTAHVCGMDTPPSAEKRAINVPAFDKAEIDRNASYFAILGEGQYIGLENKSVADQIAGSGMTVMKRSAIDRNQDGKTDLVYMEFSVPQQETVDEAGRKKTVAPHKQTFLMVDDDFDNKPDRLLMDMFDGSGNYGADGSYETEQKK